MSIDWSKAPEGATHYQPESRGFHAAWFRLQGGKAREMWVVRPSRVLEHIIDPTVFDESMQNLIARPVEPATWNGQGLPPVGLMVEWKAGLDHDWQRVTVLAYANGDAWFQPEDGPSFIVGNPANFRRIRTPEQLAAEEREKAINQMISDAGYVDPKIGTFVAMRNLYDAGYRRREEGK
ncbi:hypothetical protein EST35_0055 [Pseudomonas phage vB_PaeM_PA5oct]|uniref:Uncharacterized protein n=1 Tax=Pseudomonas phage vB_PaeM_PA5oct TaxID=2163605 RepID=A0A4Y5JT67_9CAUD|nr:hypothetical protein PQE65_gp427 [Pseudomonas phage vB_PaeM_PA5oct]QCG75938.1 hypothetical protein EST35_0055 [Pseudomonas phage vB_PaeM_PA5oct]